MALVDNQTMQHFVQWIHAHVADRHQEATIDYMLSYLAALSEEDYRYVIEHYDWRKIEDLALIHAHAAESV